MGRIAEQTLVDIQQRCDIVELIRHYIPLKKAGRNFKALCPFHHEKTASFTVNPDKQIFHCFGCGVGGDIFAFVMKFERLEFPEAVRMLAERTGVILEDRQEGERPPAPSQSAALYKVNELAARFFETQLAQSATAQPVRAYLAQRGLTPESQRLFRIGYALPGWDSLRKFFLSRRIPESLQEASGLVVRGSRGNAYDRFRNRVMFPIANAQGKIVGFGGRILPAGEGGSPPDPSQPKYVNSPETAVYSKGGMVYGLQLSKTEIPRCDTVLVVEGYFDMLMPYQAGVRNIVASLGTAFTPQQARLLKRYTRTVILVYDADTAGQEAAVRSLEMLLAEDIDVRVASLPTGYDPDAYIRRYGAEALQRVTAQAAGIFDFSLAYYRQRFQEKTPEAVRRITTAMLGLVRKVNEPVLRALYVRRLSESLHIPEQVLYNDLQRPAESPARMKTMPEARRATSPERLLIMMLVSDPARVTAARQRLDPDEYRDPAVREIVQQVYGNSTPVSPAALMQRLSTEKARQLLAEVLATDWGVEDSEKTFTECVCRVKTESLATRREHVLQQLKTLSSPQANEEDIRRLQQEYGRLTKELQTYGKKSKDKN